MKKTKKNDKRDTPISKISKIKKNGKKWTTISIFLKIFEKKTKEIQLLPKLIAAGHPHYASRFWGFGVRIRERIRLPLRGRGFAAQPGLIP